MTRPSERLTRWPLKREVEPQARLDLSYPALITYETGVQGALVDFPDIIQVGSTLEEVERRLAVALRERLVTLLDAGEPLPPPSVTQSDMVDIHPHHEDFDEKASEKFLDFTKAEFDRVLEGSKRAEERAKQNATYALAVIPILVYLKGSQNTLPRLPVIVALALVLSIVLLGIAISRNISLKNMGWNERELELERLRLWYGYRQYADVLSQLQSVWIANGKAMRRARDHRFRLLSIQNVLLVLLVFVMAALIVGQLFPGGLGAVGVSGVCAVIFGRGET